MLLASAWPVLKASGVDLPPTAKMTEGPFYPDRFPLDTDNDLVQLNQNSICEGEITYLSGKVTDREGKPLSNTLVEIWQVDANGIYLHSRSANAAKRDLNFQGYGKSLTDLNGNYYFRTIKPVVYPGRAPHIHFALTNKNKRLLTTQMLIKDHPLNKSDLLLNRIETEQDRATVLAEFKPEHKNKHGVWVVQHNLILGLTASDA